MLEEKQLPEETDAQGQEIVHALQHVYDTTEADQASLARIRERFLQKSSGLFPSDEGLLASLPSTPYRSYKQERQTRTQRLGNPRWMQRFALVAALFLVATLVGSLSLIFLQARHSSIGQPPFQERPGWKQLVVYEGTGSKTISNLSLTLPHLYTTSVTCIGGSKVEMRVEGSQYIADLGLDPCVKVIKSEPISANYTYNLKSYTIHKITVEASAQTKWYLRIDQAATQPDFTLAPYWHEVVSGGGDTATRYDVSGMKSLDFQARTWGVVVTCLGQGKGTVQLNPLADAIVIPSCSLQPQLFIVHAPATIRLTSADINLGKGVNHHVSILSCQDEATCAGLPASQIVKVTVRANP